MPLNFAFALARKKHISAPVSELQEEQLAIHQQSTAAAVANAQVTRYGYALRAITDPTWPLNRFERHRHGHDRNLGKNRPSSSPLFRHEGTERLSYIASANTTKIREPNDEATTQMATNQR